MGEVFLCDSGSKGSDVFFFAKKLQDARWEVVHCTTFFFHGEHLLHVGWRNFFSSCAVVSVFDSGGK
jgi:hypothetical protein